MRKKSIYEMMVENVENGILKEEFRLPDDSDNKIKFAPGAMDGIMIYHMGHSELDECGLDGLKVAIFAASEGKFEEAEAAILKITKKNRTIGMIDTLQQMVIDNKNQLDASNIYKLSIHMMIKSENCEGVKVGLVLLELFNLNDKIKECVRIIGLSDEFTIFAVFLMRNWEDGQNEILEAAKKVNGWGRIHAVNFIEPISQEIEEWLLYEGVHNSVVEAYSGLAIYEKANVWKRVCNSTLEYKEWHAILDIVNAMLDEEPVQGISQIENAEELLERVLRHAARLMPLKPDDYDMILNITDWEKEDGDTNQLNLKRLIDNIFCDERCRSQIKEEAKKGKHIRLAKEIDISYKEE